MRHAFDWAGEIYDRVASGTPFFMQREAAQYLAVAIAEAGPGNHVEIGTAFGGSAAFACLLKRAINMPGEVYSIDPLPGTMDGPPRSFPGATESVVRAHLDRLGAEVSLVLALSDPWPIPEKAFVSALIDGEHDGQWPKLDYANLKDRVSGRIVFHDYADGHSYVDEAVKEIHNDGQWRIRYAREHVAVLERAR